MHAVKGSWTNEAETWFNPSCGLRDAEGDDAEGVTDPKLPVQEGNPVDGFGPGDPERPGNGPNNDCRGMDNRTWREKKCDDKYVKDYTLYKMPEVWTGLEIDNAWISAVEFYQCRSAQNPQAEFSDIICDFFHGPNPFKCHEFNPQSNGCQSMTLCLGDPGAAGKYILNTFSNIFRVGS